MYLFFAPLFGMFVVFLIRVCIDVAPEILSRGGNFLKFELHSSLHFDRKMLTTVLTVMDNV